MNGGITSSRVVNVTKLKAVRGLLVSAISVVKAYEYTGRRTR